MGIRIIGGELRGRKLQTIAGQALRPTSERVRESIFNIIANRVCGARVLDLFAGSGALGIEALSRGAAAAVFVEQRPQAVAVLERNLQKCRLEEKARVIRWDIRKNLSCLKAIPAGFDLVFMDPPYDRNHIAPALCALEQSGALQKGAGIVIEHSVHEAPPAANDRFCLTDQRTYRKTLVSLLTYVI